MRGVRKDLTGERFGEWVVLRLSDQRNRGEAYWECWCRCGEERFVLSSQLTRGRSTSCGHSKLAELTGQQFGKWTAVQLSPERNKYGALVWLCRCACGTERLVPASRLLSRRSTGCGKGECNVNWRGGRNPTTNGYIQLHDPEHPNAAANGYVLEHQKVMSEHLGRPLRPKETVHHRNGVKYDNRLDNLELWGSNHPAGQRIEDKIKHYIEELRFYCPEVLK